MKERCGQAALNKGLNNSCSSLIVSPIVMISSPILSKGLHLKREVLSHAKVISMNNKDYGSPLHFL